MNRVIVAISMEDGASWPASADGRLVKSEHSEDMYGTAVEDVDNDHDDVMEGLSGVERYSQAAVWRRNIDARVGSVGAEVLRLIYADSAKRREDAAKAVAVQIDYRTASGLDVARDECLYEAGLKSMDIHNHSAREMLLDMIRSALKGANDAVGI